MSISVEQKMEIARKLVAIPQHYGKNGKINDSHLCEFKSNGEWMVVSVRPIDSGRKTPSIGIYFSDKRKHLQSAKQIGLPDGFHLQEDLITEKSSGWISYGRHGCDAEEMMYQEIVNPGTMVEAWKGLFEALKNWAKKEMGCDPIFYAKENDVGIAEALGGIADGTCCENVTTCEYQKMVLKNGGLDPAKVPVDDEKWKQAGYGDDVRALSELGTGVISWVSTVEEVAKKLPIRVRGMLVKPAKLRIPPYQRKFAWKEQDVRLLCKDLLKTGDGGNYHLGTVILHHERTNGEDVWNVVDGQQRLTNIMAILHAPIFASSNEGYVEVKQFLVRDYVMICHVLDEYSESDRQAIVERLARCTLAFISVEDVVEAFQLFTTQNGRGKPLTPVNLLKAYHYKAMEVERGLMSKEEFDDLLKDVEKAWESANTATIASAPGDGKLLLHVFREYLFRLRLWCRGQFPQMPFNASNIDEFKGVTIKKCLEGLPLQNGAILRTGANGRDEFVARRLPDDTMNPYVSICQTVVNGSDFFKYAQSYVSAYKDVFEKGKVVSFHRFYLDNCLPKQSKSGAAMYARHVFEALCMFCYDRFGGRGLETCYRPLFACAYYERVSQARVLYRRCGLQYAPKAIEAMMTSYSVEDVQGVLNALRSEICLQLGSADYVKGLLKKTKPTRGEAMQRSAYMTITK